MKPTIILAILTRILLFKGVWISIMAIASKMCRLFIGRGGESGLKRHSHIKTRHAGSIPASILLPTLILLFSVSVLTVSAWGHELFSHDAWRQHCGHNNRFVKISEEGANNSKCFRWCPDYGKTTTTTSVKPECPNCSIKELKDKRKECCE